MLGETGKLPSIPSSTQRRSPRRLRTFCKLPLWQVHHSILGGREPTRARIFGLRPPMRCCVYMSALVNLASTPGSGTQFMVISKPPSCSVWTAVGLRSAFLFLKKALMSRFLSMQSSHVSLLLMMLCLPLADYGSGAAASRKQTRLAFRLHLPW